MTRAYLAFTDTGLALARRLADALPGSVDRCGSGGVSLAGWTALQFAQSDALVFVGAVGIAVRAIAPHCRSKASDPAVVVLDECGRFAVPVLSGHLGGANDLARALAAVCGAVPVITTVFRFSTVHVFKDALSYAKLAKQPIAAVKRSVRSPAAPPLIRFFFFMSHFLPVFMLLIIPSGGMKRLDLCDKRRNQMRNGIMSMILYHCLITL